MRGVSAQASESDRPPRLVHRGYGMFPVVTDLAVHMIDRPRGELGARALEARALASAEAHGGGCTQRNADDMLENRPVLVPADAGSDAILDEEGLFERLRIDAGEPGGAGANIVEPVRERVAGREAARLEIIGPAERAGQPLAFPLLELERGELGGFDALDQRGFFGHRYVIELGRATCRERVCQYV